MPLDSRDVAHAELEALRTELLARTQSEGTIITAALTIVAAVGGFALAKKDGRIEMLLVLPLVLSGLGIALVQGVQGQSPHRGIHPQVSLGTGPTTRDNATDTDDDRSWEHFMHKFRRTNTGFKHYSLASVAPVSLIFVVPSVASLIVTAQIEDLGALWWLWGTGVLGDCSLHSPRSRPHARRPVIEADRAGLKRTKSSSRFEHEPASASRVMRRRVSGPLSFGHFRATTRRSRDHRDEALRGEGPLPHRRRGQVVAVGHPVGPLPRRNGHRRERRAYACPHCDGWHLTSQPKRRR